MKKYGISRAASNFPICYFETLMKWSDIVYSRNKSGKWEVTWSELSFNPIRKYIRQLDEILLHGKIEDHKTLCELRHDLSNLEEEIHKKNLEGLNGKFSRAKFKDWFYVDEKGRYIETALYVREALKNADVRSIMFDSEYCSFTIREEAPRLHYTVYRLQNPDAIRALIELPIVPFRFFEKECNYSEDPIKGIRKIKKGGAQ